MSDQSKFNKTKPPLTYYGGKQQLSQKIIGLIPEHLLYTEVFFGGGAIFFAKEPRQSVINDTNNNLINFYYQLKTNNKVLIKEIEATLYAQEEHRFAWKLYQDKITIEDTHFSPEDKMKLQKAWAVFVLAHQSYLSIFGNTWNFSVGKRAGERKSINNNPQKFNQKKLNMVLNEFGERLQDTSIFNDDALKVLMYHSGGKSLAFRRRL
jgi:DNA adenine methylase